MRTLSQQELSTVSGGFFLFCMKPVKKPVCIKLPKPPKHSCHPKPVCDTTPTEPPEEPGIGEG